VKGEGEMSTRKDATYDLIMLALGAVDELWSRVFDSVKAWAGEETSDRVAAAMVGWREAHRAQQAFLGDLADRVGTVENHNRALDQGMFQISDRVKILEERIAYVEEGDAGPRLSEADEVVK